MRVDRKTGKRHLQAFLRFAEEVTKRYALAFAITLPATIQERRTPRGSGDTASACQISPPTSSRMSG
jgi:hypothetical protein